MKKRLSTLLATAACLAASLMAAPAFPGLVPYTQPDGSVLMVRIHGNEYSHSYTDSMGQPLVMEADGTLREALPGEPTVIKAEAPEAEAALSGSRGVMRGPGVKSSATLPHLGSVRTAVILVQFSDVKFTTPNPRDYFNRWLNQEGFSDNGAIGSVRDYFVAQSGGNFTPQFDVYGPVTLNYTRAKYKSTSDTWHVVHDAAGSVDSEVNFANYDLNGDGEVDNVYIIFAGMAGNIGGTNTFWPHNSTCPTSIFQRKKCDGKTLVHYAICGETNADGAPDGIGTFVHEFGHVLGLADHYNTSAQNDYTPNWWDVMDVGNFLDNCRRPCNYSAYQRMALDWAQPAAVLSTTPASVELPGMDSQPFFVKIETGRDNDYFLLENRVKTRFDSWLHGDGGMLIWHIDAGYSELATKPNNNTNHLAVDLVRADNDANNGSYDGIANDLWPGGTNNTAFTATSAPPMTRWESSTSTNRIAVDRPVTNIRRDADKVITFDFMGGSASNLITFDVSRSRATFSVEASPAHGGTVYIGSDHDCTSLTVDKGASLELHAEPAQWYEFTGWSHNGNTVSTSATYTISNASDTNAGSYTATFTRSEGAPAEYCYPTGNLTSPLGGRYTSKLIVSKGDTSTEIALQSNSSSALYYDNTSAVITVKPGDAITITPSGNIGDWVHSYFYVDWDMNGFVYNGPSDYLDPDNGYRIKPGVDLMFYSRWSPYTQDPSASTPWYSSETLYNGNPWDGTEAGSHNYNCTTPIQITIPADVKAGTYRARFKNHWQSLDPCGNADVNFGSDNTMNKMGGVMTDFTIKVERTVSATYENAAGYAKINGLSNYPVTSAVISEHGEVTFEAVTYDGYIFDNWTGPDGSVVSTDPVFVLPYVDATNEGTYALHHHAQTFSYTVKANPLHGGRPNINGSATSVEAATGARLTFNANPNSKYRFVNWTREDGSQINALASYWFNVPGTTTPTGVVTANFELQPGQADFCEPSGNLSGAMSGRYTRKLTVTDNYSSNVTEIGTLQSSDSDPIYHNALAQEFTVMPGAEVTVTPDCNTAAWLHTYLYVDWDGDGFDYNGPSDYVDPDNNYAIRPGCDMVFYSRWCPYDEVPSTYNPWYSSVGGRMNRTNCHNFDPNTPITFTVPDDLAPGTYRVRFKVHWQSLDPCGYADATNSEANTLANVGGCVVDFTMRVSQPESLPLSVTAQPAEAGTVWIGDDTSVTSMEVPAADFTTPHDMHALRNSGYHLDHWEHTQANGTTLTVTTAPEFTLEEVSPLTSGAYTAVFLPGNYTDPAGEHHSNYFLRSITTTGGISGRDVQYTAASHPGKFHTTLSDDNHVEVQRTCSFTLHLRGERGTSGTLESDFMDYSTAIIYTDWYDTGTFGSPTYYCTEYSRAEPEVLSIDHPVTIPGDAGTGLRYMRVMYVSKANAGTTGSLDHITPTSTDIQHGCSYDVPVMLSSIPVSLEEVVTDADATDGTDVIFDVQGRRLSKAQAPGIYIINGVKTTVR